MQYILAIDIGNTNITAGIFKGGDLVKKAKLPSSAVLMEYSASFGRDHSTLEMLLEQITVK